MRKFRIPPIICIPSIPLLILPFAIRYYAFCIAVNTLVSAAGLLALGTMFYILRTKFRSRYGLLEAAVILTTPFMIFFHIDGMIFALSLIAIGFAIARSLETTATGLNSESRKKWDHVFGFHKLEQYN